MLCVTLSGWIAWTVFSFGLRFSPNGMNLKTYSIVSSIVISFTVIATVFVYIKLYNATKIKDCSVKTVKGLNPGGALGYFLGGYVPPGTPNWHPFLKKNSPKIDTPL